jgi:predicted DNA-binding protein
VTVKQETQTQTAIRLPDSLLARIDKLAERMAPSGMTFTRADVHRIALTSGVEQLEREEDDRSKGRKKR